MIPVMDCKLGMRIEIAQPRIKLNRAALVNVREATRGRYRAVWVARLDCRPAGPIHSTDRVMLYTGRTKSDRLCGFHAAQWNSFGERFGVGLRF